MSAGGSDAARQLVARLERLLEERSQLMDTLGRLSGGKDQGAQQAMYERLEGLTREQERIVAQLAILLPPDEGQSAAPPN